MLLWLLTLPIAPSWGKADEGGQVSHWRAFLHILVFPFIEHLPSTVLNDVHAMSHLILIRTLFFNFFFYFERERKREGERETSM